ncbi:MAG TPA: hypothetical protein VE955_03850 [Candidatus Dormibacteraeota bacterium]|nr:hypothetical protein [Candidatus Dormibacteraeota bacterium]
MGKPPVWVQFDSNPTVSSYETFGVLSGPPPATIDTAATRAPHTVNIGVYSNAA